MRLIPPRLRPFSYETPRGVLILIDGHQVATAQPGAIISIVEPLSASQPARVRA